MNEIMVGTTWHSRPPANPVIGDCYADPITMSTYVWTGSAWTMMGSDSSASKKVDLIPTPEQLEKHPALKQAWEEYLVIKRMIG